MLIGLFWLGGCSESGNQSASSREDNHSSVQNQNNPESLELPLPVIPDNIKDDDPRREYAGMHFWDSLNFNDTTKTLNDEFMEQNFTNFILFLQAQTSAEAQKRIITNLLSRAAVNQKTLKKITEIARLYLAEPNSPMRSDNIWMVYLEAATADERYLPGLADLERARYELKMLNKNKVGSKASNFAYIDSQGGKHSLYDTQPGKKVMLLVFYDSDCENCDGVFESMMSDSSLNSFLSSGDYVLLAIDAKENKEAWIEKSKKLPKSWKVGFNTDGIVDRDIYWLPALPAIYVLDTDYKVMKRD